MVCLRPLFKFLLLLLTAFIFAFFSQAFFLEYQNVHSVFQADFFQYWSAGKVFLMGLNPYDPDVVLEFQKIHWFGKNYSEAIMLWYPPIAFSLILPFSLFNFEFAAGLWFFLNAVLLIYLLKFLYQHFELRNSFIKIFILCSCSAPVLYNLIDGQISFILLAGLCFYFISALKASRPAQFAGGLALSLTLIKPHLLFLVYLLILIEALKSRKYLILVGMLSGVALLAAIPLIINADIFNYYYLAAANPPIDFKTPTLGSWLQELLSIHTLWLRFLPAILLSVSFLIYYFRNKNLSKDLLIYLLPFSLLFSPYGWNNDQVLLLPIFFLLLKKSYPDTFIYAALMLLQLISVYFLKFPQEFHIIYPVILINIAVIVRMMSTLNRGQRS